MSRIDDVGAHADGDLRGVQTGDTATEDDDLGGLDARVRRRAGRAATAVGPLQRGRTDLRAHPAGDLGHRGQQRQRPVGQLDGLVGDRRGARRQQRVGALARTPRGAGR